MTRVLTIARMVWLEMLRRKDLYVLSILLAVMIGYLLSIDVFGENGANRYVAEIGLMLTWLFSWVLTINLAVRQLPTEERTGTVFPLLAKPVTRAELIVGKWLGAWFASAAATFLFYLLTAGVILLRGGELLPASGIQAFLLHAGMLAVLAALAVALSTRLSQGAAATLAYVIAFAAFALVPRVPEALAGEEGLMRGLLYAAYFAVPNFELFDMRRRLVHGWGPAPGLAFAASLGYAAAWSAVLIGLAHAAYRRKFFSRGDLA